MRFPRASGILLHPTSLPGGHGIGDLGPEAYAFADYLEAGGQRVWQVLPLGPTGFGDSPYQCFSSFAGNPLLVSPDLLGAQGYLGTDDLNEIPGLPRDDVDFGPVIRVKTGMLRKAFAAFTERAGAEEAGRFTRFCTDQRYWLDDYALFMALKEAHGGEAMWTQWDRPIAARDPAAVSVWNARLAGEVRFRKYEQFEFFRQWNTLREYCHARGIRIMGDIPIYVAHDSADVWAHRELFRLDENGRPTVVAGVPPDYFSATGQLWGNPIYDWPVHEETHFAWWIDRLRSVLKTFDIVRIDHFRGLEAYWEVPSGESTAVNGRWVKGPGSRLLAAAREQLRDLPIVAENLGVITDEVEAIRSEFDLPGMAILQFAFGSDPQGPSFRPHNYPRNLVAYTGTHDNDPVIGWWRSQGSADSTRTPEDVGREIEFARRYLDTDGSEINWVMIRALMASVADTVIFPLQDVLGLGSEARMNMPSKPSGNWRWRVRKEMLTSEIRERLKLLSTTYDR